RRDHAHDAALDGAIRMPQETERWVDVGTRARHHVARHSELAVAGGSEEIALAALLPDDDFRAHEVRPAREVEADEGQTYAGGRYVALEVAEQRGDVVVEGWCARVCTVRLEQRAEPGRSHHHRRPREESGRDEVTARPRPRVILMPQRLTERMRSRGLFEDEHRLSPKPC